jgi:hypothetical protein
MLTPIRSDCNALAATGLLKGPQKDRGLAVRVTVAAAMNPRCHLQWRTS